jgi:hypothetical protein
MEKDQMVHNKNNDNHIGIMGKFFLEDCSLKKYMIGAEDMAQVIQALTWQV